MSTLKMDIYTASTGVQMTFSLASEDEYQLAKSFLTKMNANCGQSREPHNGKPEFFYLQNDRQLDTFCKFLQALREKREP